MWGEGAIAMWCFTRWEIVTVSLNSAGAVVLEATWTQNDMIIIRSYNY